MSEKLKTQQRDNDLERLAHEFEMKLLNQKSAQQAEQEAPDNRCLQTVPILTLEGNMVRNEKCYNEIPSFLYAAGSRCWSQSWSRL